MILIGYKIVAFFNKSHCRSVYWLLSWVIWFAWMLLDGRYELLHIFFLFAYSLLHYNYVSYLRILLLDLNGTLIKKLRRGGRSKGNYDGDDEKIQIQNVCPPLNKCNYKT